MHRLVAKILKINIAKLSLPRPLHIIFTRSNHVYITSVNLFLKFLQCSPKQTSIRCQKER